MEQEMTQEKCPVTEPFMIVWLEIWSRGLFDCDVSGVGGRRFFGACMYLYYAIYVILLGRVTIPSIQAL